MNWPKPAWKIIQRLRTQIEQDFRQAAVWLQFKHAQTGKLGESSQSRLGVAVVVVRHFVETVEKRYAYDHLPRGPEKSCQFAHKVERLRDVFQYVGKKHGIKAFGWKRQRTSEIHHLVYIGIRMKRIFPIDADVFRDEIAVCLVQGHIPAAYVEKTALGMGAKRSLVIRCHGIDGESGRDGYVSGITRRSQSISVFDELRWPPEFGVFHVTRAIQAIPTTVIPAPRRKKKLRCFVHSPPKITPKSAGAMIAIPTPDGRHE